MRTKTVSVPSAFQRMDSRVTDPDEFVNARDQQVARLNHNILLAKRLQPTLFSRNFTCVDDTPAQQLYTTFVTRKSVDEFGAEIIRQYVFVPPHTKKLRLRFFACKSLLDEGSELATDPVVYADVWNQYARKVKQLPPSATVSAANGSPDSYTIDIHVPPVSVSNIIRYGRRVFEFGMWVGSSFDYTQSLAAGVAFSAVGTNHLTTASAFLTKGRSVHFGTDLGIEQRQVVKDVALGGGQHEIYFDKPFSRVPDVAGDTMAVHEILGIDLYSATLRCMPITDFGEVLSL